MTYAKLIDQILIFPSPEDFGEDQLLINPELWYEYFSNGDKPEDTAFNTYSLGYIQDDNLKIINRIWTCTHTEPIGRVAKLNGNILYFPQQNDYSNGCLICNYPSLPNSRKMGDGWMLVEETECPIGNYRETGIMIPSPIYGNVIKIVWEEIIPEPVIEYPFEISKVQLKRALVNIGKWTDFKTVLAMDSDAQEEFNLAVTLMSNDPLVLKMITICSQVFGMTTEQITELLKECKSV